MDKETCIAKLGEYNIRASLESGVVMVDVYSKKDYKDLVQTLKTIGYSASYGVRFKEGKSDVIGSV